MEVIEAIEKGKHLALAHKLKAALGVIHRALALYRFDSTPFKFCQQ